MALRRAALLAVLLLAVASLAAAGPSANKITSLPGLSGSLPFNQYSGYINVNAENDRNLFYWFVESKASVNTDPLVLWLNGGPGCSSVGNGMLSELGPLYPDASGQHLLQNPWAWNANASVIFLESPAGVGFSYSGNTSDYTVGDARTALDAYNFLQGFLKQYPEYATRDLWITGESYGGHYVPTLVAKIVEMNKQGQMPYLNLVGFMVGNGWTDAYADNVGAVTDWYTHATISNETYTAIMSHCNFSAIGPLALEAERRDLTDACTTALQQARSEQGNINIYNIYVNVCTGEQRANAGNFATPNMPMYAINSSNHQDGGRIGYNPCVGTAVHDYLNTAAVQQALHVNMSAGVVSWHSCSPVLNYSQESILTSMLPVYRQLLQENLRILVYSGDVDAIVPTPGTRAWLAELNLPVKTPWHPWFLDGQVGGFATEYEGLTFTTVRNAGHMVPYFQPSRALYMFSNFLAGSAL